MFSPADPALLLASTSFRYPVEEDEFGCFLCETDSGWAEVVVWLSVLIVILAGAAFMVKP